MNYKIIDERLHDYPLQPKDGDAGIDLRACIDKPIRVATGETVLVPSGLQTAIPKLWVGLLFPRSGLGVKHGLVLGNTVGVIDSSYRGEILIAVTNRKEEYIVITPMDRIAQLVLVPHYNYDSMFNVNSLDDTERGSKGFGASGVK
jgi:dUTP pyrophosphatase